MTILSIHFGHNSTSALMKNGHLIACISEERINREKNTEVFPQDAIKKCLEIANLEISDIDKLVVASTHTAKINVKKDSNEYHIFQKYISSLSLFVKKILLMFPNFLGPAGSIFDFISKYFLLPNNQNEIKKNISKILKIEEEKIVFADHHTCHAYAAYYGFLDQKLRNKKALVITHDAEGDRYCQKIWIVEKDNWNLISTTKGGNSVASFYGAITKYLGMKMNEHEYKVMGLAPYASKYEVNKNKDLFKNFFKINKDFSIVSKIPSGSYSLFFKNYLFEKRFDTVSFLAQQTVEDVFVELIKGLTQKYKEVSSVVLGGGVFMNVKANQKISDLKSVKHLTVCPSSGDESLAIGGCYLFEKNKKEPVNNLYLGPSFPDSYIEKILKKNKLKYKKYANIESKVADLLASGKIVARFSARMEWGARALGNRSILMDPRRTDLKEELNNEVKSRDFWMPFAPTILAPYASKYLRDSSPHKKDGRFMILSYETSDLGQKALAAAIHPKDKTARPQILFEKDNPDYFKLISHFKEKTGVGAILNTSFNYHGEPIVCSPVDAINTFKLTDLKYLAISKFLVEK